MNTGLTTFDGFPRDDIDVALSTYHVPSTVLGFKSNKSPVRTTRARIIYLRTDYNNFMSRIEAGLHKYHASMSASQATPSTSSNTTAARSNTTERTGVLDVPFAKVNSVVAGSPADDAGLKAGDEIRRFGTVNWMNHEKLGQVAATVQQHEGVSLVTQLVFGHTQTDCV